MAAAVIHWCGTGLSSVPGLRRLIAGDRPVTVWNRPVEQAWRAVGDLTTDIRPFDAAALTAALRPGDVLVSMLPAEMHLPLAERAVAAGAHFVASSYLAPAMARLDARARAAGLAVVGEVGLDPGIDHLMAHALVAAYRASADFDPRHHLSFRSHCGGFPRRPGPFRYKFSWSPVGVLRALMSPAQVLRNFSALRVDRPWDAVAHRAPPLPVPETFEVYPNRDSLPFLDRYGFDPGWAVRDFERGTLRPPGWAEAWAEVFADLDALRGQDGDARLQALAERLWAGHAYAAGEPDRVVLCVDLAAEAGGRPVWHQGFALDACGDARGSAMARLVSTPVALAVEAVLDRSIPAGVHGAPSDPRLVEAWLAEADTQAQHLYRLDLLA